LEFQVKIQAQSQQYGKHQANQENHQAQRKPLAQVHLMSVFHVEDLENKTTLDGQYIYKNKHHQGQCHNLRKSQVDLVLLAKTHSKNHAESHEVSQAKDQSLKKGTRSDFLQNGPQVNLPESEDNHGQKQAKGNGKQDFWVNVFHFDSRVPTDGIMGSVASVLFPDIISLDCYHARMLQDLSIFEWNNPVTNWNPRFSFPPGYTQGSYS